jgi:hypothetical protein
MDGERLLTARVFVTIVSGKIDKLPAAVINSIVTNKTIPTTASATPQSYMQIFTKGEVSITVKKETEKVGNDQEGTTGVYRKSTSVTVKIPLSKTDFDAMMYYSMVDPDAVAGDTVGFYKENAGVREKGLSLLIYDKSTDNANFTDIPDFTNDPEAQILFNCVNLADTVKKFDGGQDICELEFEALAITDSGSAKGTKGGFGTFDIAA